jgi:hypothetical protein
MLEVGYDGSTMEHLIWRQLKGAWQVGLALVGHDYETMPELLAAYPGIPRVFFIPNGRVPSLDFDTEFTRPEGDVLYVFGRPLDNLVSYLSSGDTVVSIKTPGDTDMMAVSVVGIVMHGNG